MNRDRRGAATLWPLVLVASLLGTAFVSLATKTRPSDATATAASRMLSFQPTLPQSIPDTVRPITTHTIPVATASALQSALDTASCGAKIQLTWGTVYETANGFSLDQVGPCTGTGWIYVGPDTVGQGVSFDNRVDTTLNFPIVRCTSSNCKAWERTLSGEVGLWSELIEFAQGSSIAQNPVEMDGFGSASGWPERFVFDRIYIHSIDPLTAMSRCMEANGKEIAVLRSVLVECKAPDSDVQAYVAWDGPGPHMLYRNLLSASTENVMFGGACEQAGGRPADITVVQNHFFRPHAWFISQSWLVKNVFEIKNAERIHMWGNVLENNWPDGQTGYAILFKSTNQSGTCPQPGFSGDIFLERNIIKNSNAGIRINRTAEPNSLPQKRVWVENLWFKQLGNGGDYGAGGSSGRPFVVLGTDSLTLTGFRVDSTCPNCTHTSLEIEKVAGLGFQVSNYLAIGPTQFGLRNRPTGASYPDISYTNACEVHGTAANYSGSPEPVGWTMAATEAGCPTPGADTVAINLATCGVVGGNFAACTGGPIPPSSDVSIAKSGLDSVGLSDNITYQLVTVNVGPDSAKTVVVIDSLPGASVFVSANRSAIHSAGVVTWPAVNMPKNDTVFDTVVVTAPGTRQTIVNTAVVTLTTADPDAADRRATWATLVSDGPTNPPVGDTLYRSTMDNFSAVTDPVIGSGLGSRQNGGVFAAGGYSTVAADEYLRIPQTSIGLTLDTGTVIFNVVPNYGSQDDERRDILFLSQQGNPGWWFSHHSVASGSLGLLVPWRDGNGILHEITTNSDTAYVGWIAGDTVNWRITWNVAASPNIIRIWQDGCEVTGLGSNLVGGEPAGAATDSVQIVTQGASATFADQTLLDLVILDQVVPEANPSCPGTPQVPTFNAGRYVAQQTYDSAFVADTAGNVFNIPIARRDSTPVCEFLVFNKSAPATPLDTLLIVSMCAPPTVWLDSAQVDSLATAWSVPGVTLPNIRNRPIGN